MGFVANIEAPAFDIIPITPIRVASRKVRITVGGHRVLGANGNGLVIDVTSNVTPGSIVVLNHAVFAIVSVVVRLSRRPICIAYLIST